MTNSCNVCGNPVPENYQVCNHCNTLDKTQFITGAVRNSSEGKGRYDLLPWEAIHELAIHCEEGAKIYGERNVEKGIPIHSLLDSATRHISCYMRGMRDEPHLRAALWNIAFAIWMEKRKPEMQDIPQRIDHDEPIFNYGGTD